MESLDLRKKLRSISRFDHRFSRHLTTHSYQSWPAILQTLTTPKLRGSH